MYCQYYQAKTLKNKSWFVSGCFRNEENLVFARSLNPEESIWEFFVPQENEKKFLEILGFLQSKGFILSFEKLPNRLA